MEAKYNPERPQRFRHRLAQHEAWTPELREHAIRYLIANTIRPGAMALRELAGIEDRLFFKTDIAPALVDRLTPRELLGIWDQWLSLKGNYWAEVRGDVPALAPGEAARPTGLRKLPARHQLPPRWHIAPHVDVDQLWAKVIALAVRNAVEDLHADGAFSDQQAPTFNREVRNRIYNVLVAWRHCQHPEDPFGEYLKPPYREDDDTDGTRSAISQALQIAISQFMLTESIDYLTTAKLQTEARKGAQHALDLLLRFDRTDQDQIAHLIAMIPDYWEPCEMSDVLRARLEHEADRGRQ